MDRRLAGAIGARRSADPGDGTHAVDPQTISELAIRMTPLELETVDDRAMPDISLQHLVSLLLLDGDLTFDSSHDDGRMHDPAVVALKQKITLVPDPTREIRRAHVTMTMRDGTTIAHQAGRYTERRKTR